jgi:hypothetical protein
MHNVTIVLRSFVFCVIVLKTVRLSESMYYTYAAYIMVRSSLQLLFEIFGQ